MYDLYHVTTYIIAITYTPLTIQYTIIYSMILLLNTNLFKKTFNVYENIFFFYKISNRNKTTFLIFLMITIY